MAKHEESLPLSRKDPCLILTFKWAYANLREGAYEALQINFILYIIASKGTQ